jgi:mxaA protein
MAKRFLLTLTSALLACSLRGAAAAPVVQELSNTVSQHFGLLVGDRFTQQVRVAVAAPHELDRNSLPKKGRANRWLELQHVELSHTAAATAHDYLLTLKYQVITSDEIVSLAALPRPALRFSAAGMESLALRLGEQHVSISPISDTDAWEREGLQALRPEHGTPLMDVTATKQRMAGYAAALALLGLFWLYRIYGAPFVARSRGPFMRAWRALRRQQAGDAAALRSAMLQLHRAFDATFGKSVLRSEVETFLVQHPRFAAQREAIERFFDASRYAFYGDAGGSAATLAELREFARRLSLVERGLT